MNARRVDRIAALLLVLLGVVHSLGFAPLTYDRLDARALWFVSGGLALGFAGAVNLIGLSEPKPGRATRRIAAAVNIVLAIFVLTYQIALGAFDQPQMWALTVIALWLAGRSTAAA